MSVFTRGSVRSLPQRAKPLWFTSLRSTAPTVKSPSSHHSSSLEKRYTAHQYVTYVQGGPEKNDPKFAM